MPEETRPTFDEWITANWPSGRFNLCIGKPVPPGVQAGFPQRGGGQPILTTREKRYCYTIAITHGHMGPSAAKDADRTAWLSMRCSAFLGRPLPGGPLATEEEARYQAALNRLPPS